MALACGVHSILDIGIHDVRHVWKRAPAGFGTKGNDAALLAHDRLEAEQVSPSCIFETIGKFPGECDGRILAANRLLLTMCALELHFNSSVSTQFNVYRIVHSARKDTANDKLPTNGKHIRVYRVRKVELAAVVRHLAIGELWELNLQLAEVLVRAHRVVVRVRPVVANILRQVFVAGPEGVDVELYAQLPRAAVDHAAEPSVAEGIP